jgi:hypothetical protein
VPPAYGAAAATGGPPVAQPGPAGLLPALRELDLSYCPLPQWLVARLLACCTRLEALHLNGVNGVTAAAWGGGTAAQAASSTGEAQQQQQRRRPPGAPVAAPGPMEVDSESPLGSPAGSPCNGTGARGGAGGTGPSQLRTLSLVRCHRLRALWLGPGPFDWADLPPPALPGTGAPVARVLWGPAPGGAFAALAGLRTLRLGLSAVEGVALELPLLEQLELNGCTHLRTLRLSCPRLRALLLQSCGLVGLPQLRAALLGCPAVEALDLQHTGWASLGALQQAAEREGGGGGGKGPALARLAALAGAGLRARGAAGNGSCGFTGAGAAARQQAGPGAPAPAPPRRAAGPEEGLARDRGGACPAPAGPGGALQSVAACGAGCPVCSRSSVMLA